MPTIATLVDLTKIQILSVGTGPLLLGAAIPGFRGVEALIDGKTYTYSIQPGSNFELGQGIWNASAGTLSRGPIVSSYGGSPVPLPPNAICTFTVLAADLRVVGPAGRDGNPGGPGGPGSPGNPGSVIYSGTVDPDGTIGIAGDYYINLTSSVFFGPRTLTAWPAGISLKGVNADYGIAGNAVSSILASEILIDHVVIRACSFAANLAGSQVSVGTPPAATFALDVQKNGTSIGTISIATSGTPTLTTVGGTAKALAIGDVVTVIAPAGVDASIARLRMTLKGA